MQKPIGDFDRRLDCLATFVDRINELLEHVTVPDSMRPRLEEARLELVEQLLAGRNPQPFQRLN
jgi:hypothetical protein